MMKKMKLNRRTLVVFVIMIMMIIAFNGCQGEPTRENYSNEKIEKALSPEEFEEKLAENDVVVIDVRTIEELEEVGKYKDAIHIDSQLIHKDLQATAKLLPEDKDTTLLIYCRTGNRASKVIKVIADELGYKNTYYLAGSIFFDEDGNITGYEE